MTSTREYLAGEMMNTNCNESIASSPWYDGTRLSCMLSLSVSERNTSNRTNTSTRKYKPNTSSLSPLLLHEAIAGVPVVYFVVSHQGFGQTQCRSFYDQQYQMLRQQSESIQNSTSAQQQPRQRAPSCSLVCAYNPTNRPRTISIAE